MLLKIREKSQGLLARIILLLIGVTFALWGIQNYVGGGSETAVASVGDKEFYQQDINRAYSQYSQNLAGMNFDENVIKKQALEKLIQDEVLLQYVESEGLVVTDETAKEFIKGLDYFQTDGKFDNKQYKSLLAGQRMTSVGFVAKIKKALVMEQFQRSIAETGFTTEKDLTNFFRIQNQTRKVEIIPVALQKVEKQPEMVEIEAYYQKNNASFLTAEQASIEYIELSLDNLAKQVAPTAEQLATYYDEQKDLYTTKERRKISHILFAFTKDTNDDDKQLQRAINAKQLLAKQSFSDVAAEQSDDKVTAVKGGDLGLFNIGVMEKAFEDAVASLQLNEVSDPVKSAFGYHLIKVTELVPGEVKSFEQVKAEVTIEFQRSEAETTFYELGEALTDLSYESPDSLQAVSDALDIASIKTKLFSRVPVADKKSILSEQAVINAAFSEDVLKGNNSEPIELGSDRLIVLRTVEHRPAEVKALDEVKDLIVTTLLNAKARQLTADKSEQIKQAILAGQSVKDVADKNGLEVLEFSALTRGNGDIDWQLNQAIFKAAKPVDGKATVFAVAGLSGAQSVVNLHSVTEGVMTESDKAKQVLAENNMAKAFGQADFNAVISSLRASADVTVKAVE